MPTYTADITVDQITCQNPSCSGGPTTATLVITNAYLNADGYMYANGTRLPEDWVRMTQMDSNGRESAFKVYCPICAADL